LELVFLYADGELVGIGHDSTRPTPPKMQNIISPPNLRGLWLARPS
jgi:hypothetical protein